MKKSYLYIFIFLIFTNCTLKEVEKHHGFHYLDKKNKDLYLNKSNKNDILNILGPPSTKGSFDNDIWIYIEITKKKQSLLKLGKTILDVNNILVLEIDERGLLVKKDLYNKDNMNDLEFSEATTKTNYNKDNFIYNFMSSMRQKVNDPLGKRKSRRKK